MALLGAKAWMIVYRLPVNMGNCIEITKDDNEIKLVPMKPEFSSGIMPVMGSRYCQPRTSIMM
jgi:hypothetical protein